VNGSISGEAVALRARVGVAENGLGVDDGVMVGVDDEGRIVAVAGREVNVGVGAGWMKERVIPPQATVSMRVNIIIKKRRMDIL
jgi:hypothetical protein